VVTLFEATAMGFTAHSNQPLDASALSLFDTEAGVLGPADVLVQGAGGPVRPLPPAEGRTIR
jgi:hypothetical protein